MSHGNRRSIRLKDHDYSKEGSYFVTIDAKCKGNVFGVIENNLVRLNDLGEICKKCWLDIPKHFSNVVLDEWIVMPDHIHGIVCVGEMGLIPTRLSSVIKGFKIGVTVGADHHPPFVSKHNNISIKREIFQRNYYEKIIWNEKELIAYRKYIKENPMNNG